MTRATRKILLELIRNPCLDPGDRGPCPDADLLAGFVRGSLLPEEQEAMEEHLARCPECLGLVARLAHVSVPRAGVHTMWRRRLLAAAAVLALALAGGLFFLENRTPDDAADPEKGLATAAKKLARLDPVHFGSFRPVSRDRLRHPDLPVERGEKISVVYPASKTLETSPRFRWEPLPLVDHYRVALMTDAGEPIFETTAKTAALDYPESEKPLLPGQAYLLVVAADAGEGRRRFLVASTAERAALEAAFRAVDTHVPGPLGSLVKAHYSLEEGYLEEAESEARAYVQASPASAIGRDTLYCVLKTLGSPEAGSLAPEPAVK